MCILKKIIITINMSLNTQFLIISKESFYEEMIDKTDILKIATNFLKLYRKRDTLARFAVIYTFIL